MSLLQLTQFACCRNTDPLFEPINYTLNPGELVQVVGPNGAGKTTLLRSLCGLYSDYTGDVFWQGRPHQSLDYAFQRNLLYLGHHTGVKKNLTAKENLDIHWGLQGVKPKHTPEALLAYVGLSGYEDTLCQDMSAGQMRRVALARLYGSAAPLWVLDEPFTAIDVHGVAALEQLIHAHCQQGGSVILTTHQAMQLPAVTNWYLQPCTLEAC